MGLPLISSDSINIDRCRFPVLKGAKILPCKSVYHRPILLSLYRECEKSPFFPVPGIQNAGFALSFFSDPLQ